MRLVFVAGTFHWVKIIGKQASPKEAPIVVVAPHSSFFDSLVAVIFGPPSVVAKAETSCLPFFGSETVLFSLSVTFLDYLFPSFQRSLTSRSRSTCVAKTPTRATRQSKRSRTVPIPPTTGHRCSSSPRAPARTARR